MEAFDLDHYELIVGNHTMNIDAKENVVIILLFIEKEAVVANIMAVDRCGKKSINSSKAFSGLLKPSGLCNTTRSIVCTCVKEVVAITLPVSVVAASLGIIISAVVTWRVCFRQPKVHSKKSTSSATNTSSREDLYDTEAEEVHQGLIDYKVERDMLLQYCPSYIPSKIQWYVYLIMTLIELSYYNFAYRL